MKSTMITNNCDWHSLIKLDETAKENYLRINEQLPGVTNYEAVKKYLQRLKKRPNKKYIFHNRPQQVMKSPGEFHDEIYRKSIYERHKVLIADNQNDISGFSYDDYCRMCCPCYKTGIYFVENSVHPASDFM